MTVYLRNPAVIRLKIPAIYELYFKAMVHVATNHIPLYLEILENRGSSLRVPSPLCPFV